MTQPTQPTSPSPPPADLPWGISYLREDIQDLRQEIRHEVGSLRAEIRDLRSQSSAEQQALRLEMNGRFARADSRFWLQVGLILTSWISLAGLLVLR